MTDRELLEAAAKAAGLAGDWSTTLGGWACLVLPGGHPWQPLHDDGDALRLAVKLGMVLDVRYTDPAALRFNEVCFWPKGRESSTWKRLQFDDIETDLQAATRRAIVRAAAEISQTNAASRDSLAQIMDFRTAAQAGVIAGDGKPCPNDHDPDCRWPQCNCRQWGQ